jgi:hypothetical protein
VLCVYFVCLFVWGVCVCVFQLVWLFTRTHMVSVLWVCLSGVIVCCLCVSVSLCLCVSAPASVVCACAFVAYVSEALSYMAAPGTASVQAQLAIDGGPTVGVIGRVGLEPLMPTAFLH